MPNTAIFYTTVLLTSAIGLGLAVVSFSFVKIYSRNRELKDKLEKLGKDIEAHKKKTISNAEIQAKAIVDEARLTANKKIAAAVGFSETTKKEMQEELSKVANQQLSEYKKVLLQAKDDMVKVVGTTSKNIEGQAQRSMDEFVKSIEVETQKSQGVLRTTLTQMMQRLEADLTAYKQNRLKQVEAEIVSIVDMIAKDAIGSSLTERDKTDLVINALEDAKKSGLV